MSAAVVVENLIKRYGARAAVDGASFEAATRQITAILGPNGAGKTTTVETCEGFRRPDAGRVRVLGLDPLRDGPRLKPRVGVMLQEGGVYPGARPLEMLRLIANFAADPRSVDDLSERLGLDEIAHTPYRRLSGGEKQRLSLAMALVGRPELVFLDEPTAGMDPQARRTTWALIEGLRREGVTVVLTTHSMEEAEHLADHVVIVDRGRVIASDSPSELTRGSGALRFTAPPALDLTELVPLLPPGATAHEEPAGHYAITGDVTPHLMATVTRWFAERSVLITDVRTASSLEEVFFSLTDRE